MSVDVSLFRFKFCCLAPLRHQERASSSTVAIFASSHRGLQRRGTSHCIDPPRLRTHHPSRSASHGAADGICAELDKMQRPMLSSPSRAGHCESTQRSPSLCLRVSGKTSKSFRRSQLMNVIVPVAKQRSANLIEFMQRTPRKRLLDKDSKVAETRGNCGSQQRGALYNR